jgi:hypothetical protein
MSCEIFSPTFLNNFNACSYKIHNDEVKWGQFVKRQVVVWIPGRKGLHLSLLSLGPVGASSWGIYPFAMQKTFAPNSCPFCSAPGRIESA